MGADKKVIFSDTRAVKTVTLPSYEGSEVEVYTELNVWQQREITAKATNDFEKGIYTALVAIKDWNLYKDETTKLEISEEVLRQFKDKDLMPIFAAVSGKTEEEFLEFIKENRAALEIKKNIA